MLFVSYLRIYCKIKVHEDLPMLPSEGVMALVQFRSLLNFYVCWLLILIWKNKYKKLAWQLKTIAWPIEYEVVYKNRIRMTVCACGKKDTDQRTENSPELDPYSYENLK